MNKRAITLVHGDFHPKNLFWHHERKWVLMTDFSEIGLGDPVSDLAQYVISDVDTNTRRLHELDILKAYWNCLISEGVNTKEYPFSCCLESYKKDGISRWILMLPMMAYWNVNLSFFNEQVNSFIGNHNPDAEYIVIQSVYQLHENVVPNDVS